MFMTNYEYVYGKSAARSNIIPNSVRINRNSSNTSSELLSADNISESENANTGFVKKTADFIRSDETAQKISAIKRKAKAFAGIADVAASKTAKNAADFVQSEETAQKLNALKNKAQSTASGLGSSISEIGGKASTLMSRNKRTDTANGEEYIVPQNTDMSEESIANNDDNYAGDYNESYEIYGEELNGASDDSLPEYVYEEYPEESDEYVYSPQSDYTAIQKNNAYTDEAYEQSAFPAQSPQIYRQAEYYKDEVYESSEGIAETTKLLLGIIAFLLLALGATIGIAVTQQKNNKSNNNAVTAQIPNDGDSQIQNPYNESGQPNNTIEPSITTTESEVQNIPQSEIENAYTEKLIEFSQSSDYSEWAKYGLYDINGDGVPELFISYLLPACAVTDLYEYKNSQYVKVQAFAEGAKICLSEHLIENYGYGGYTVRFIYEAESNGAIIEKDAVRNDPSGAYYRNEQYISKAEYDEINNYYDSLEWISVDTISFDTIISDFTTVEDELYTVEVPNIVNMNLELAKERLITAELEFEVVQDYDINIQKGYIIKTEPVTGTKVNKGSKVILYVSKGSDTGITVESYNRMVVDEAVTRGEYSGLIVKTETVHSYENEGIIIFQSIQNGEKVESGTEITLYVSSGEPPLGYGFIATDEDALNLRMEPSTNSKVITEISKGEYIDICEILTDWYFVCYKNAYGYVSKQYVDAYPAHI